MPIRATRGRNPNQRLGIVQRFGNYLHAVRTVLRQEVQGRGSDDGSLFKIPSDHREIPKSFRPSCTPRSKSLPQTSGRGFLPSRTTLLLDRPPHFADCTS